MMDWRRATKFPFPTKPLPPFLKKRGAILLEEHTPPNNHIHHHHHHHHPSPNQINYPVQMDEGSDSTRYWCHECSRIVETIAEAETIKCSLCNGGFVEELDSARSDNHHHAAVSGGGDSESDRALSLWAPILLRMMSNNPRPRRRFRQIENDENDENDEDHNDSEERYRRYHHHRDGGESSELDRELESIMRRRRRSSATIIQLLQGIRAGMITESENNLDRESGENNRENQDRDRERVILMPFNQTIIIQGGGGGGRGGGGNLLDSGGLPQNHHPVGSLGDYFVGPGLELLLQHLAENDPNRYGTPPAQKEAVEAMPTVAVDEDSIQCSICLDDFEIGAEAKEMPCKHRFHGDCILPWLELHSSCPVCRYQLPSDESKLERDREASQGIVFNTNAITGESASIRNSEDGDDEGRNPRRFSVALQWPFSSLLPSPTGTQISNPPLIMNPSSSSGLGSGPAGREGGEGGRREDDD